MPSFPILRAVGFVIGLLAAARAGKVNRDMPILAKDVASPVELEQREKRLQDGAVIKQYHQTTIDACKAIMKTRFYVGKSGIAGGGIYWAQKALHTQWKAEANGCMIEAWVAIGKQESLKFQGDRSITPTKMLKAGYDSVWLPRGCRGPPCNNAPTPETVIYFSDQILQMTAYPCRKDGTKTGEYFPGKDGHAGPLSSEPPTFIHSEGIWGEGVMGASYTDFTVQYATIGEIPSSEDLCPACPVCNNQYDALSESPLPKQNPKYVMSVNSILLIVAGIGMMTAGTVLHLSSGGCSKHSRTPTSWTDTDEALL